MYGTKLKSGTEKSDNMIKKEDAQVRRIKFDTNIECRGSYSKKDHHKD